MRIAVLNDESLDVLVIDTKQQFNLADFIVDFLRLDMKKIIPITDKYKYTDSSDQKETLDIVTNAIMDILPLATPLFFKSYLEYLEKKDIDNYDDILPDALPYFYLNMLEEYMSRQIDLNTNFLTQILSNELANPSDDPEYLKIKIYYYPYNYQGQLYEAFKFDSLLELTMWGIIKIIKAGLAIKECQNCHRLFIPQKRSDEIYCDYIYRKSRTCKQVGYENKDEFTRAYRTAYKTKNAAKNRNKNNNPNAEKNFKMWVYEARLKLEEGREGKISLDDFREWLRQGSNQCYNKQKKDTQSFAETIKGIAERAQKNQEN